MTTEKATGKLVLVVEDNEVAREGLGAVLRRHGYAVVLAADAEEALDYLMGNSYPGAILLDMLMPVLDGWGFLKRVHGGFLPGVPIVVMAEDVLSREWALDNGCAGFVKKPIDTDALLQELRRCLPGE